MNALSIASCDNRFLDKFFLQSSDHNERQNNFKKLKSVLRFVFHLKEKNILDDKQLESLVKLSCSIYLEQELEDRLEKSLSKALSKIFSTRFEEEMAA